MGLDRLGLGLGMGSGSPTSLSFSPVPLYGSASGPFIAKPIVMLDQYIVFQKFLSRLLRLSILFHVSIQVVIILYYVILSIIMNNNRNGVAKN